MDDTKKIQLSPSERRDLLLRPAWTTKEIEKYFCLSQTAAYHIRSRVLSSEDPGTKKSFRVIFGGHRVKRDGLLQACGTTVERELELANKAVEGNQNVR